MYMKYYIAFLLALTSLLPGSAQERTEVKSNSI